MSLFGTVSSPTTGVCVLIFQQQSAVHAHAARLSPILCVFISHTYTHMHKYTPATAQQVDIMISGGNKENTDMKQWKVSEFTNNFCGG